MLTESEEAMMAVTQAWSRKHLALEDELAETKNQLSMALRSKVQERGACNEAGGEWDAYLDLLAKLNAVKRDRARISQYANSFEVFAWVCLRRGVLIFAVITHGTH